MDRRKQKRIYGDNTGPSRGSFDGSSLQDIRKENKKMTRELEDSINKALEGLEIKNFRNIGGQ